MPQESLRIDDQPGSQSGQRILRLDGALVLSTMFEFQRLVRADDSRCLISTSAVFPTWTPRALGRWSEPTLHARRAGVHWPWFQ